MYYLVVKTKEQLEVIACQDDEDAVQATWKRGGELIWLVATHKQAEELVEAAYAATSAVRRPCGPRTTRSPRSSADRACP